ncbi:MAG: trypsin-like peptidase domain-containing protein [Rhizobacter sp.]|nr:trypsin-like peptidase domain-containing protein [Ferruginibacter sp.]
MKSKFKIVALAFGAVAIVGGYALYANANKNYNSVLQTENVPLVKASYTETATPPVDFEKAATSAVPAVVHIKTTTRFKQTAGKHQQQQNPFGDMFGDNDMFKKFFGDGSGSFQQPEQKASGSGVVISTDGYIVTNNHVVDGATDVSVTLNDRKTYKAKVIGTDANTDLALIKIDAKNLTVMPLGNSDDVHLGQWVLAIGYPLNLDVTVTQGIVSAKSRNIGINRQGAAPVEAFIQTDAAVNPGSSGGALVNTNGELIGINAAIASPTGSYAGYAYSIPSNLMKKIIGDIMKFGSVQRGYLGISMAPSNLDDAKKKELGINDEIDGVWIMETDPTGAAAEAGIKKGDAVTKINDVTVKSSSELAVQIATQKPGDKITVTVLRGKEEKIFNVVLKSKMGTFASQKAAVIEALGAEFATLNKEDATKLGITGGVQVTNISDGIIRNQTNMRQGFVITKVGDTPVKTVDELKDVINNQGSNFQIRGVYPDSKEVYYYGINDFKK